MQTEQQLFEPVNKHLSIYFDSQFSPWGGDKERENQSWRQERAKEKEKRCRLWWGKRERRKVGWPYGGVWREWRNWNGVELKWKTVRGRVARMMMIYRVNFGFHFPFLDFFSYFFSFSFLEIVYNIILCEHFL